MPLLGVEKDKGVVDSQVGSSASAAKAKRTASSLKRKLQSKVLASSHARVVPRKPGSVPRIDKNGSKKVNIKGGVTTSSKVFKPSSHLVKNPDVTHDSQGVCKVSLTRLENDSNVQCHLVKAQVPVIPVASSTPVKAPIKTPVKSPVQISNPAVDNVLPVTPSTSVKTPIKTPVKIQVPVVNNELSPGVLELLECNLAPVRVSIRTLHSNVKELVQHSQLHSEQLRVVCERQDAQEEANRQLYNTIDRLEDLCDRSFELSRDAYNLVQKTQNVQPSRYQRLTSSLYRTRRRLESVLASRRSLRRTLKACDILASGAPSGGSTGIVYYT